MGAIKVIEHVTSRSETVEQNDGDAELIFTVMGTGSALAAREAVYNDPAGAPPTYHGLFRGSLTLSYHGAEMWNAKVKYGKSQRKVKISIDGMCDKIKMMRSIRTVANWNIRDLVHQGPDHDGFGGLIGVTQDKVEGVEVYANGMFKIDMQFTDKFGDLQADFVETCLELGATVNEDDVILTWKNQALYFERGELLFIGAVHHEAPDDGCETCMKFLGNFNDAFAMGERSGFYPDASTTIVYAIDSAFTGVVPLSRTDFPDFFPFTIKMFNEEMQVTGTVPIRWTVTRGVNATTPATHTSGTAVTNTGTVIGTYGPATTILLASTDDTQTTIEPSSGVVNFPTTFPFVIVVETTEQMQVTALAGGIWTVVRGFNATTPTAHPATAGIAYAGGDPILHADAATTLFSAVDLTQGTIDPVSGAGFPPLPFVVTVDAEDMLVTASVANPWTVTRGFNGTTAASHAAGDTISYTGTAVPSSENLYALIEKEGWHYVWIRSVKVRGAQGEREVPNSVHIEQTQEYGDFSRLGVFFDTVAAEEEAAEALEDEQEEEEEE